MKKLLFILLCLCSFAATAQTNPFDIGLEGGLGIASLRGNEFLDKYHSNRIGYTGGLFAQYNLPKVLSLRTGAYFERKGSSSELQVTDDNGTTIGSVDGWSDFDYLTVPLMLRATFGDKLRYFVNAGPYVGFLLKQTTHTDSYGIMPETNEDNTDLFEETETGMAFGLGLSYALKSKLTLSFEARNNLGLTDMSKLPVFNGGEIKTNAVHFMFGIGYRIGG